VATLKHPFDEQKLRVRDPIAYFRETRDAG